MLSVLTPSSEQGQDTAGYTRAGPLPSGTGVPLLFAESDGGQFFEQELIRETWLKLTDVLINNGILGEQSVHYPVSSLTRFRIMLPDGGQIWGS